MDAGARHGERTRRRRALLLVAAALAGLLGSCAPPGPAGSTPEAAAGRAPVQGSQRAAVSPEAAAAAALRLNTGQVLGSVPFAGGTLEREAFHGGRVLLWAPEPDRLEARASLDLGDGTWRSTANSAQLTVGQNPGFLASVALLNDLTPAESRVPLHAFFGTVTPGTASVSVQVPGVRIPEPSVRNGTWLTVYQGIVRWPPGLEAEVIAWDASGREVGRQTLPLP